MIISHKYKFIFIKTRKTAGTSIEVYLSSLCGPNDVFTPITPHIEPHIARNYKGIWNPFREIYENRIIDAKYTLNEICRLKKFYNHIPARFVKTRIPKRIWNSYFKFCVERNPWDKTLSHYYSYNRRTAGEITLNEFLEYGYYRFNYPLYTDLNGNVLVDRIINFESLHEELKDVFSYLGIPFDGFLGVKAKTSANQSNGSYRDELTTWQKEFIKQEFSPEIEMHGYEF